MDSSISVEYEAGLGLDDAKLFLPLKVQQVIRDFCDFDDDMKWLVLRFCSIQNDSICSMVFRFEIENNEHKSCLLLDSSYAFILKANILKIINVVFVSKKKIPVFLNLFDILKKQNVKRDEGNEITEQKIKNQKIIVKLKSIQPRAHESFILNYFSKITKSFNSFVRNNIILTAPVCFPNQIFGIYLFDTLIILQIETIQCKNSSFSNLAFTFQKYIISSDIDIMHLNLFDYSNQLEKNVDFEELCLTKSFESNCTVLNRLFYVENVVNSKTYQNKDDLFYFLCKIESNIKVFEFDSNVVSSLLENYINYVLYFEKLQAQVKLVCVILSCPFNNKIFLEIKRKFKSLQKIKIILFFRETNTELRNQNLLENYQFKINRQELKVHILTTHRFLSLSQVDGILNDFLSSHNSKMTWPYFQRLLKNLHFQLSKLKNQNNPVSN